MVIADYRFCLTHHGNECALADIWETEKAYISEELKLELNLPLLTRHTVFGKTGSLTGRCRKVAVTPAAFASARCDELISV